MIRLARHIEILLLGNECVIVPNLGGFVEHHVTARYDTGDGIFLPPLRTLGFNPLLKMNDSLLAQSYVEAYDLSYPEAVDAIESEVREVLRIMGNSGSYELENLGRLYYDSDGRMNFEPCEAGILTPEFYALSSFDMKLLSAKSAKPAEEETAETDAAADGKHRPRIIYIGKEFGQRTLNISLKAIRNISVAAAVVATVFLVTVPLTKSQGGMGRGNIESGFYEMFMPKDNAAKEKPAAEFKTGTAAGQQQTEASGTAEANSSAAAQTAVNSAEADGQTTGASATETEKPAAKSHWSIVICSHVSKSNADILAAKLRKEGLSDVSVSTKGATKVVYGNFSSRSEAQNRLNALSDNASFKGSWVVEVEE